GEPGSAPPPLGPAESTPWSDPPRVPGEILGGPWTPARKPCSPSPTCARANASPTSRRLRGLAGHRVAAHPPDHPPPRRPQAEPPLIPRLLREYGLFALGDKGYDGLDHALVVTAIKGRDKPEWQQASGCLHARLRGPGERVFAQLKAWEVFNQVRCDPHQVTQIAKAVQVLNSCEHHPA